MRFAAALLAFMVLAAVSVSAQDGAVSSSSTGAAEVVVVSSTAAATPAAVSSTAATEPAAVSSTAAATPAAVSSTAAAEPAAVSSTAAATPAAVSSTAAAPEPTAVSSTAAAPTPAVVSSTAAAPTPAAASSTAPAPTPAAASSTAAAPAPAAASSTAAAPTPAPAASSSTAAAPAPAPAASSSTGPAASSSTGPAATATPAPAPGTSTGAAPATPANACQRITKAINPAGDFTNAATQYAAMQKFVQYIALGANTTSVPNSSGVFNNAITKPYFDGTINYRQTPYVVAASPFAAKQTPNYVADPTSTEAVLLVTHLAQFFAAPLQCATGSEAFPTYCSKYPINTGCTGGTAFTQYQVHANMNITQAVFSTFTAQVANVAKTHGATIEDQNAVAAVLASFGRNTLDNTNMICTQADCACAPTVEGATCGTAKQNAAASAQVSIATVLLAAVAAFFAMRR